MESTLRAARLTTLPGTAWRGGVPRTAPCKGRSPGQRRLGTPLGAAGVDESPRPRGALARPRVARVPGPPVLTPSRCCIMHHAAPAEDQDGLGGGDRNTSARPTHASPEMGRLRRTLALPECPREALGSHREREKRGDPGFSGFLGQSPGLAYSPRRRRDVELGGDRG